MLTDLGKSAKSSESRTNARNCLHAIKMRYTKYGELKTGFRLVLQGDIENLAAHKYRYYLLVMVFRFRGSTLKHLLLAENVLQSYRFIDDREVHLDAAPLNAELQKYIENDPDDEK